MKTTAIVILAAVLCCLPVTAASPDLIVVISIDQFPQRYLPTFQPWFSSGGFNRFLNHGAHYDNAYYPYSNTYTCPGHATIGTGRLPYENGIVTNNGMTSPATKTCTASRIAGSPLQPGTANRFHR